MQRADRAKEESLLVAREGGSKLVTELLRGELPRQGWFKAQSYLLQMSVPVGS